MTTRVLSVSQLYPGVASPLEGVFVHHRLKALPDSLRVAVWRVRPWFPVLRTRAVPSEEVVEGIPVSDVPFFYLPGVLKGRDGDFLLRALRRRSTEGVDVIDAHFAYPAGWAALRLGQERGIPVAITLRGTEQPYSRDPARRRRIQEAVCGAHAVICVSSSLAELARGLGADPSRVHVVGNGIDGSKFCPGESSAARSRWGIDPSARVLLTVGGLTERKGVARVLEVLPEVLTQYPDLLYVVVGGGGPEGDDRSRLERRIEELGLGDRVRLVGRVPHGDLPEVYRAADVFVLATSNEGWANALQEAIASGVPAVATDVGGNREVLGDGLAGILVPFGDKKALADGILRALGGALDTGAVARFGRRRSWEQVGRETGTILRQCAGGPPA